MHMVLVSFPRIIYLWELRLSSLGTVTALIGWSPTAHVSSLAVNVNVMGSLLHFGGIISMVGSHGQTMLTMR